MAHEKMTLEKIATLPSGQAYLAANAAAKAAAAQHGYNSPQAAAAGKVLGPLAAKIHEEAELPYRR
jgi:hypothetical protein